MTTLRSALGTFLRQMKPNQASQLHQTTPDTFLYFGYGSNMLIERLQIMNKSAKFLSIGKVIDYELRFGYLSPRWNGHVATINKKNEGIVWGCVYALDVSDMDNLDEQEGVSKEVYKPINVEVQIDNQNPILCRTYQLVKPLEDDAKPSDIYKKVLLKGATQHELPQDYIDGLNSIESNGYNGEVQVNIEI